MSNFLDKWNKNKFAAYESEEKTVLNLITKQSDFIGEIAKEFDGKTDLNGDHKGTWQGLNRPTLSEEGMRATVEKLNTEIPLINEKINKIDITVSKMEKYLSSYNGEGSTKLQNAINDSQYKTLIIDEDITLSANVNCPSFTHIKGMKGKKINILNGKIVIVSNTIIEHCEIENLNLASNFGGNRGIQCYGESEVYENIVIKDNTIKNFFYNIDFRTNTTMNKSYKHKNIRIENNNLIHDYNTLNGVGFTCGNLMIQDSQDVFIINNFISGGVNSSALGVTGGSSTIVIDGNIIKNNMEASIQIENFLVYGHSQEDVNKSNVTITNNICDGAIWIDDSCNVNVNGNKSDSIFVTVQQWDMKNIIIDSNITGVIYCGEIYTPVDNVFLNNLVVSNNNIIGYEGYHDQTLIATTKSLNINTRVKSSKVFGNYIDNSKIKTYGIEVLIGYVGFEHIIYGNYDRRSRYNFVDVSSTDGILRLYPDTMLHVPRYTTVDRDSLWNPQIGSVIYDSTLKKLLVYKDATSKWVNVDGTAL